MKILTIVGARPQFIKAAMISKAIGKWNNENEPITELILHTGQHYDKNMSDIFFSDMEIPRPFYRLECQTQLHGEMTSFMLREIEKALLDCNPDYLLVYGDTNSTLAGALAASKMHIPVIHVEAGLRSFNKNMPEEINRVLTDHVSAYLFCPTLQAVDNLQKENISENVFHVGDVMFDAALLFGEKAKNHSIILQKLNLSPQNYYLATVHRAENTGEKEHLSNILNAFVQIATETCPVIFPIHPRTKKYLREYSLTSLAEKNPFVKMIDPVGFIDMVMLEKNAKTILTDSGGIQKEAYFHQVPCITLREETEWTETIEAGWNQLAGPKTEHILTCLSANKEKFPITEYGEGNSAEKIIDYLCR